ncbi:hypothetical protein WJX72_011609 [[Myrmecia] bisecta]|uniref:C3H1-type domain-containing protein n=1 Tax=[Myrmecia] bisecta TaxID=41462 RepID=A0AAW1PIJ7_9CHLO
MGWVYPCDRHYNHDWRSCPHKHESENARRRDPRVYRYLAEACPHYKTGLCLDGDACAFSHGIYECWLHPSKYRTVLCKDLDHCRRETCFFAHSPAELRQPDISWNPILPPVSPSLYIVLS